MRYLSMSCILLLLVAGNAAGQGVNFSVKVGSLGKPGTGVATQAALEAPENDVCIGGGCTNYVRLLHTKLGLLPGDDIDALCYPPTVLDIFFEEMVGEDAGWFTPEGMPVAWHFSVDPNALGRRGTAVNTEVTTGTSSCRERLGPNEAHGDYFFALWPTQTNTLGADEALLGLTIFGSSQQNDNDDLNALDLDAPQINRLEPPPPQFLLPGDLYFSLAAGSPSLRGTGAVATEDDVLTPDGSGGFQVAMTGAMLGILPGADLDALYMDVTGIFFFSVKNLMPSMGPLPSANPGDILVPDGMFLIPPDGVADELIPARDLGLMDMDPITRYGTQREPDPQDDNLDALDAALVPWENPPEPEPVKDLALPIEGDEGEGEVPIEGEILEGELPEGELLEGEVPVEGEGEPEPQHGPNITVNTKSLGLSPPPLPRDINTEGTPWNDIYKAGGTTSTDSVSIKRLTSELLSLATTDDIDAISYGDPAVALPSPELIEPPAWIEGVPHGGWEDPAGNLVFWHFSVDGHAVGIFKTDVNREVNSGTQWLFIPPTPNEAHGDYFVTSTALSVPGGGRGTNLLVADEENVTLAIQPGPTLINTHDDLNGLDLLAALIDRTSQDPQQYLQPGDLFFSLAAGSPSLAMTLDPIQLRPCHEADILTPDGNGHFRIARMGDGLICDGNYERLGIPDFNDLDALYCDANVFPGSVPCFSVRDMIPAIMPMHPNANPGDILVPDGMIYPFGGPVFDGVADEMIPARDLGLRDFEDPLIPIAINLLANFASLDIDSSGGLSWAELGLTGLLTKAQFDALDADRDGELTEAEMGIWILEEEDNLNALDCEIRIVRAELPLKGIDQALQAEGEGEGEGELPEGELPEGELPEGELPEGELPEGELPEGELLEGELPEGEQPEGELPEGELPEGELPEGELPEGELPEGELPEGELPEGELPEGELPEGELPEGELPEGELEGEIAEGEVSEGEVEGEVPEGEGEGEGYHPADTNSDWRIVISEAIAYIAGWQQGTNPIAYAIRAAYLWQNGEFYTYDPEEDPPLCWVLDVKVMGSKSMAGNPTGQAAMGSSFIITPLPGTNAWGVELYLPEGLLLAKVAGTNGVWDGINRKVSWWGTGDMPIMLEYTIAGAPGTYVLNGEANFDGISIPLPEVNEVRIAATDEPQTIPGDNEDANVPVIAANDAHTATGPLAGVGDNETNVATDDLTAEETPCCGGTLEGLRDSLADWLLVGLALMVVAAFSISSRA